jgi:WD40 repeat protein
VTGREKDKVEVAHEVLFGAWEELKSWLQDELLFLRWQRSIQLPLQEWEQHERNIEDVYLSGALLREARDWLGSHVSSMNEAECRFVEASLKRAQEEEERWQRSYQISLARQLAAQAQVILTSEPAEFSDRALLLAVEAMRRCTELGIPSLEADQALRQGLALMARRTAETHTKRSVNFHAVSVHPCAPTVAYGQEDGQVWLWNLATNETDAGPQLHSAIQQVVYSPDGQWLVIGDESGDCLLLNTASGEVRKLGQSGSRLPTRAVTFSPDGLYVAVGFHNRAQVWDLRTSDEPIVIEHPDAGIPIVSMTFSGDGTVLVTQQIMREALCWKWKSKQLVGRIGNMGNQVLHSPDGRFLGVTGPGSYEALLWDVYKRETRQIANNGAKLAFSADGRFVGMASPEHFARTWHLPDLTEAHTMRHNAEVWHLDFSPDGSLLVTAAKNNVAHVWNTHTGDEVARMVHRNYLWSVRFLADSRHVLTQSGDSTLTVWDTKELRETRLFEHQVAVLGVAFSPDGRCLATHAREGWGKLAPILIDPGNYQPLETVQLPDGQQVSGIQYAQELLENHKQASQGKARSPNREFLAVAEEKVVKIYRTDDGTPEGEAPQGEPFCILPHEHDVSRIVFSPDGQYVVTTSDHDTARIWDVSLATEVSRLTHKNPNVVDVDFHPSGALVATASWDFTARIWTWKPEDLMHEASTRLTRNLSAEEWRKYLPAELYRQTIPKIEDEG